MSKIESFKDLIVWQKSMELALDVYKIASSLPQNEQYGLCSQLKRSAVSIPSNIAEGHKRGTKEFIQFLKIAYGSSAELETQLLLSQKLFPKITTYHSLELVIEIQKILSVFIKKLNS